ncbi:nitric oxide dioxygenase OS=Streptomyces rochei OX=1928 GN=G3I25_30115 PE=3 SV=1 [Streptomyces rochei]
MRSSLPDGSHQIRQYSLSAAPGRADWRITVKRVRGGARPEGEVSSWLHAHARPGDVLTVSAPFGDLALDEGDGPLLLASAGIGVTPVLAMLDHLAATGSTRPVTVVHADRGPADHAHRQEQLDLVHALPGARLHLWYEEPGDTAPEASAGRADVSGLDLPAGLTAYLCGPVPFMRAVRGDLLRRGVPAHAVHYEVFGPDLWLGQE